MSPLSIIDSLPEDAQQSLLQLATLLTGDAESGMQLLARSILRTTDLPELIDEQDYPEETARRQLIETYLATRRRHRADRNQEAVAALRFFCGLSLAETARVMGLPTERVEDLLETSGAETERFATWTPLLKDPPSPTEIGPELRRRGQQLRTRRRRRRIMITAAAMIIVAAVVVPSVIIPRLPHTAHAAGVWTFVHTVDPPTGWTTTSRFLTPESEATYLTVTGESKNCWITLFANGTNPKKMPFDPEKDNGDSVRVAGRPGKFLAHSKTSSIPLTLAWRYASEAWAFVECWEDTDPDKEMLLQLAGSVRYESAPIMVPSRFEHLPAQLAVKVIVRESVSGFTFVELASNRPDQWDVVFTYPEPLPTDKTEPVDINGDTWRYSRADLLLCRTSEGKGSICLMANRPDVDDTPHGSEAAVVRRLLIDVAASTELASQLANHDTWFDAREAFP